MKKLINHSLLVLLFSLGLFNVASAQVGTLDQSQTQFDNTWTNDAWQSFTAGTTGNLSDIEMHIKNAGGTGATTLSIYNGEGTSGTLLHTQTVNLPSSWSWVLTTLSGTVAVTSGTKYTISLTGNVNWKVRMSNVYSGGYYGNLSTWDLSFKTYVSSGGGGADDDWSGAGTGKMYPSNISDKIGINTNNPLYNLHVNGNAGFNSYIYHNGDTNTSLLYTTDRVRLRAGGEWLLDLYEGSQDWVKIGDGGDVDINFNNDMFLRGSDGKFFIGSTTSTINPTTADGAPYLLYVNGGGLFEEVQVMTGWADFVFNKDHKRPSILEESAFIKKNGHLMGFQSAEEMDGRVNLGDVTVRQQMKIEEMRLDMIDMYLENKDLKEEVNALKTNLDELKEEVEDLQNLYSELNDKIETPSTDEK